MLTFLCVAIALFVSVVAIMITVSTLIDVNKALRVQRGINESFKKQEENFITFMGAVVRYQAANSRRIDFLENQSPPSPIIDITPDDGGPN